MIVGTPPRRITSRYSARWRSHRVLPHMEKLESTRRRYAEVIRDLLWQRHRLRLSDKLVSAFARVPREDFLGPPPWLIRGMPAVTVWQRVVSCIALHQHYARD